MMIGLTWLRWRWREWLEVRRNAKRFEFVRDNLLNISWDIKTSSRDGWFYAEFEQLRLKPVTSEYYIRTDAVTLVEQLDILMESERRL